MSQNSVAIIGKSRLAGELLDLSRDKGFDAELYPDAEKIDTSASIVVETAAGAGKEKKRTIKQLDSSLDPSSTTLTSCLGSSVTSIASWTGRPDKVVGFATFYPFTEKKVVELAGGLNTEEDTLRKAEDYFRALGKETVRVKDASGLIFPRILSLIINEAIRSLDERVAGMEEIDIALRLGTNYPSGPLRWADQIGLDEVLAVLEGLHREYGEDRYRPAPLLRKMVLAGRLGEISGLGFYQHRT
jgi:3-hydroxybutyryl-CoA dehydrogenase